MPNSDNTRIWPPLLYIPLRHLEKEYWQFFSESRHCKKKKKKQWKNSDEKWTNDTNYLVRQDFFFFSIHAEKPAIVY